MAIIKPFHGIRYKGGNISKFICPPYDVISPKEKELLKKRAAGNMVRLELPDAKGAVNKYAMSGRIFNQWLADGVLLEDKEPAYYFYEQKFTDHGRKMVRRGFFAALKIENPHAGAVKPHEKTLSKPKADRLSLLRAVKANLSPIFGLFNDKGGRLVALGAKIARTKPDAVAKDSDNVYHKLWKVSGAAEVKLVSLGLSKENVFIADGHHRYETSWNYSLEARKKSKCSSECECGFVMIFLCPMQDKGLSIWPTHRVVEPPSDFESELSKYFNITQGNYSKLSRKSPQPLMVYYKGRSRIISVKSRAVLDKAMPGKCRAYKELGVSILHSILLKNIDPHTITYVKDEKEAIALAKKTNRMAVIVPATPIEAIRDIASAGQTMPQKSTY
ncbi:MAG: hypothetical protein A2204_04845, partial [Elusimicrobia bacterium RIFOXYA1_FULL_47_7]